MTEISHQPCPDRENCGSSDAYSFNPEKNVGHCFKCKGSFGSLTQPIKPVSKSFSEAFDQDTDNHKWAYVGMRGITEETMKFYGVKTFLDGGGSPLSQEYTYPSGGKKVRYFPKSFSAKNLRSDELFGMNLWNAGCSKMVIVTEGELDALSAYQMVKSGYITPVVSLPSATPSKKLWENCNDYLNSFEKIILSVDTDDAGNAIADKMSSMFPNKVYRIPHDKYKDANEFLQAGKTTDFKNAMFNAKKSTPNNVLNTPDQFLKLYTETPEHMYVPTGIQALDDKIMGLMQGHFTVIKAPTGIGKTEVMRFLEYNLIQKGVPFASWHLEETKLRSLLGLVSYKLSMNVTRRDLIEFYGADEKVKDAIKDLTSSETMYQFFLRDGESSDDLIQQIRFFAEACECKFVFFEPIQDVVAGRSEASKEEILADLSVRLSKVAAELNIGIVTIAHTNEFGDPKYCKMIGQRASVILDLSRDKEADTVEGRNTTYITVEKNRPCSEEGPAGCLRFNPDTFTLKEIVDV